MGSSKTEGGRFAVLGTFKRVDEAMKRALVLLLAMGLIFWFGQGGCGGSGGGGGGGDDPCTGGPVPCLTENWGTTAYQFIEEDPVVVLSDGDFAGVVATYYDDLDNPHMILLISQVIDCYNSELIAGAIDWNDNYDFEPDEEFTSVEGNVNICKEILRVSGLVLDGIPEEGIVATYVGEITLDAETTILKERKFFIHVLMKRLSIQ